MNRIFLIFFILAAGCGAVPEKVSIDDPKVQELLKAAASFDREAYGFTPLPLKANVRLEARPTGRYDAMLHIHSRTSRTIAFRKTENGYRWIREQETFWGPKTYTTEDGTFSEELCLTYEIENVSGYPLNKLNISYSGEDPRLAKKKDLILRDVQPILREWNY